MRMSEEEAEKGRRKESKKRQIDDDLQSVSSRSNWMGNPTLPLSPSEEKSLLSLSPS